MAGVVINEFLALNTDGLQDEDGQKSDWIELKNTDTTAVNLGGWILADSVDQWQIPSVTLGSNEYLVIFASGKDRRVVGQPLHTNFELRAEGESLKLLMPDGVTVAHAYDPFPPQLANVSYGLGAGGTVSDMLIEEEAPVRVHIPSTGSSIDTTWYGLGFDDTGWTPGGAGVGFDATISPNDFNPYINLNVLSMMWDFPQAERKQSAYIRIPFEVANPTDFQSLMMRIRYEDGFGLYLNGTRITAAERAAPATLAWNSVATFSRTPESDAMIYANIDLSPYRNLLRAGTNVLAIHGLNRSNASDDFLIDPILVADRATPPIQGYMATPTPGANNLAGTIGFVADTKFSVDRGFYSAPFTVSITTETPDVQIRYTTDGSLPTATTGLIYNPSNPPLINETTTLRAAAFKSGYTPTNVDTQTYIFLDDVIHQSGAGLPPHANWGWVGPDWAMDPDVVNNPLYANTIKDDLKAVPTVSLVMPWNDWFGSGGQGIYISGENIERQTSVEMFTADGTQEFQIDAAVEIQGQTSTDRWKVDKLSLQITFKPPYGPTKLNHDIFNHPLVDQGATAEFDTFVLDAQVNYAWSYGGSSNPVDQRSRAKFIQDQYVSDLQNLAGGQAPHGRIVHLYLNGLYWGIYMLHERPDETFAESYLGADKDDYDVIKHNPTTVVNSVPITESPITFSFDSAIENYGAMLNLVRQDLTVAANYQAAVQKVDIDDLIDYMIVNYYAGNDDWALKNWYATFNRVDPGGKWRFHSWDAEHVLKNVNYDAIFTGPYIGSPEEVHQRLMTNEEYRLRFSDHVQKLFQNGGLLTPQGAAAVYMARMQEADRAIVAESARWGDNHTTISEPPYYTREHWLATQNELLRNYFPNRTWIVQNQFISRGWLVTTSAPTFSHYGGVVGPGFQLTIGHPAGYPIYYTLDGSDPRNPLTKLPSSSAILYTGPIALGAGGHVKARAFFQAAPGVNDDWSAVIDAVFLPEVPFPVRITELHYNPAPRAGVTNAEAMEFIELTNTGSQTVSLAGVQLTQFKTEPYLFGSGFSLGPGERIIVAHSPSVFQSVYGTDIRLAPEGYGPANLSNSGERIVLLGPLGETLQDFEFRDSPPWPTAPDGEGRSLHIIDALGDETEPANWRSSIYVGGSPGAADMAIPGDYDGNGVVEDADAAVWRASYGLTVEVGTGADGNRDGEVDLTDFVVWRARMAAAQAAAAANSSLAAAAVSGSADSEAAESAAVASRGTTVGLAFPESSRSRSIPSRRTAFAGPVSGDSTPVTDSLDLILLAQLGEDTPRKFDDLASTRVTIDTHLRLTAAQNRRDILESAATVWEDEAWLEGLSSARLM